MRSLWYVASAVMMIGASFAHAAELNQLAENQWVQPSADGTLVGRVVLPAAGGTVKAVEDAAVAIVDRDGNVLRSVTNTDEHGKFEIRGVQPGVYALTARGEFVFACCAMHVLDPEAELNREFPAEAEVSAANIDYTAVNTAIIRYLPPQVKRTQFSIDYAALNKLSPQVATTSSFRVSQVAGGMKGTLHRPGALGVEMADAPLTNVFIVKDGNEVARAVTNERGEFSIDRLPVGQYSLMAIGADGLGLMGFELVAEDEDQTSASVTTDGKQYVRRKRRRCCPQLCMQVAPPVCVSICQPVVPTHTCTGCGHPIANCSCGVPVDPVTGDPSMGVGTPLAGEFDAGFYGDAMLGDPLAGGYGGGMYGGGGGGGSFGGGGGGGGGGGFGAIAGLAGIGGIIAAVATSDDDGGLIVAPSPPATPSVP